MDHGKRGNDLNKYKVSGWSGNLIKHELSPGESLRAGERAGQRSQDWKKHNDNLHKYGISDYDISLEIFIAWRQAVRNKSARSKQKMDIINRIKENPLTADQQLSIIKSCLDE